MIIEGYLQMLSISIDIFRYIIHIDIDIHRYLILDCQRDISIRQPLTSAEDTKDLIEKLRQDLVEAKLQAQENSRSNV